jgi:hypothetical protein
MPEQEQNKSFYTKETTPEHEVLSEVYQMFRLMAEMLFRGCEVRIENDVRHEERGYVDPSYINPNSPTGYYHHHNPRRITNFAIETNDRSATHFLNMLDDMSRKLSSDDFKFVNKAQKTKEIFAVLQTEKIKKLEEQIEIMRKEIDELKKK